MTAVSALVAWAYNSQGLKDQTRIDWLVEQRDALVATQFAGGAAASSVIAAGENGKSAGFQIDLPGPQKLALISEALEILGVVPAVAQAVTTTYASFDRLQR